MRYIPFITFLLWVTAIAGYMYIPEIVIRPEIKFPLIILLTIFIATSFWDLQKRGHRVFALLFTALFFFNTGIIIYALAHNHTLSESLRTENPALLDPSLARLLIAADDELERNTAARIIYVRHGISLPYRTADNSFQLYVPTRADKDSFINNQDRTILQNQFRDNLSFQTIPLLFLLSLQLFIFTGLLTFLIISDRKNVG